MTTEAPKTQKKPRKKRKNTGWVPDQHGAWVMVTVPLLLGVGLAGPSWIHLPLAVAWMTGYFAFFALGLWVKARGFSTSPCHFRRCVCRGVDNRRGDAPGCGAVGRGVCSAGGGCCVGDVSAQATVAAVRGGDGAGELRDGSAGVQRSGVDPRCAPVDDHGVGGVVFCGDDSLRENVDS